MRVGGDEADAADAGEGWMIDEPADHAPPQPLPASGVFDPDVGDPGEGRVIGDRAGEAHLLAASVSPQAV